QEEESILKGVEKFQVALTVEDSGSLRGLEDALIEADGYDIVHITGHAGIDAKLGPVFYMEDEIGDLEKVTPAMLWDALRDFAPRFLFLSGCSTGKSDKVNASESFAWRIVEQGVSVVLGWGLPVSDTGATRLAAELYKYLGMGKGVAEAVQRARQATADSYLPWPLLRVFSDGSKLRPLIAPGQRLRPKTARAATHKYLADSKVKVLERGFVGRRREIQDGVRVLKGFDEQYGLLIRGPAGIGKSCLAGKLIERFPEKELIVIHGALKASALLLPLRKMFRRKGLTSGLDILKAEAEVAEKIEALFRDVFKEQPTLLYFDDFEQNLVPHGDDYYLSPEAVEVMQPLLTALDWSEGQTNLLITSRYPFEMEVEGENLPQEKLKHITLMSFRDADLKKKTGELKHISVSEQVDLYLEFGKGNPRLLEWLDQIAAQETKYDLAALKQELRGKSEEFILTYLADIMAKVEGEDFQHFLRQAAVFRQPVEREAFGLFPPFLKGGQGGFKPGTEGAEAEIPPNPPLGKGGKDRVPPFPKGGLGGILTNDHDPSQLNSTVLEIPPNPLLGKGGT
ncbi:MAG: CHAT domain-containing protein, partial [Gammaproteobacteria bacterium]|nr:CHAT domain-containing protein [Gammaproteobacteria bacterium]